MVHAFHSKSQSFSQVLPGEAQFRGNYSIRSLFLQSTLQVSAPHMLPASASPSPHQKGSWRFEIQWKMLGNRPPPLKKCLHSLTRFDVLQMVCVLLLEVVSAISPRPHCGLLDIKSFNSFKMLIPPTTFLHSPSQYLSNECPWSWCPVYLCSDLSVQYNHCINQLSESLEWGQGMEASKLSPQICFLCSHLLISLTLGSQYDTVLFLCIQLFSHFRSEPLKGVIY